MLCKNCKKEIREDSEFCKYCGQKVEKEVKISFCTSCGKQIKNNTLFCKHCGTAVSNVMNVTEKDNKYNKRNLAMIVIAIVLVAIACFSLSSLGEKNTANKAADTHTGTGCMGRGVVSPGPQGLSGNDDCFVCGGDGKKDCTSCDGGFITEYETGTYMGYGSTTREIRKKCVVCSGSGEVKCFH